MLNLLGRRSAAALRARAQPVVRRLLSSTSDAGFKSGLPGPGVAVPFVALGLYAVGWKATEDGQLEHLTREFEASMKTMTPEQLAATIPSPTVLWNLVWPIGTGLLTSVFESLAARLALAPDMRFLCTEALDADYMAPTAIALLSFPVDHAPFVESLWAQGAVDKVAHILAIYKTLPPDQHDDVLTNAALIAAKAAASGRGGSLDASVFTWLLTKELNGLCAAVGIEGLAQLWWSNRIAVLKAPVVTQLEAIRTGALLGGRSLNGELANRLLERMAADVAAFEADAEAARAYSLSLVGPATDAEAKTLWQSAGVTQRETSSVLMRRQLYADLQTVETQLSQLKTVAYKSAGAGAPTFHENYGFGINLAAAAVLGGVYGYVRALARARWRDITPSTARRLGFHVGLRSAVGVALLVGVQEAFSKSKRERPAQLMAAADGVAAAVGLRAGSVSSPTAAAGGNVRDGYAPSDVPALVVVDLAAILVLGIVNFAFPYCIVPALLNPLQFLLPPAEPRYPTAAEQRARAAANAAKARAA